MVLTPPSAALVAVGGGQPVPIGGAKPKPPLSPSTPSPSPSSPSQPSRRTPTPSISDADRALANLVTQVSQDGSSSGPTTGTGKRKPSVAAAKAVLQGGGGGVKRADSSRGTKGAAKGAKAALDKVQLKQQQGGKTVVAGVGAGKPGQKLSLLKPLSPDDVGKKCLVLDLDETLVHSSFKPIPHPDFIVPVEIESSVHQVYVLKRPGVDGFLKKCGELFEVVVFTASLAKYADPLMDILDKSHVVKHRLFREACIHHKGSYVKDLSMLGRPLPGTIIIDNAPASYAFHPSNAIPITSWFNDGEDTELTDLLPFLEDLSRVEDVRAVLDGGGDE
ncbi:hypothetical protein HDU93_001784 [Gonapodya sp. JEL0774]|nr:hypothetical protein HDU93_001784 [Gonapodya sp. JEL0774]